jgi:arginase
MQNRVLLTPFFLDEYLPGLEAMARTSWQVNHPPITNPTAGKEPSAAEIERRMSQIHEPLAEAVAKAVSDGTRPVSIAGDCCTSIGVLAGLQRAGVNPLLVWFDAHGDFNTWQTTPSGFLGGMPLAMLTGRGELTLGEAVGLKVLEDKRVWLVGARDLDPGEIENLAESQVLQIPKVKALARQKLPRLPIWVHFDTDVLRLKDAPAMNYPAKGGPSLKAMREAFDFLAASGRVVAASMSTWNPDMDADGASRRTCLELLQRLLA